VRDLEVQLICAEDSLFRFHSGIPAKANLVNTNKDVKYEQ
jgi:hypothetical protein